MAEEVGISDDEALGVIPDDEPLGIVDRPVHRSPLDEFAVPGEPSPSHSIETTELDFEDDTVSTAESDLDMVEGLAEEKPAAPTWPEILQDCLFLARAKGALLIDPAGTVTASCGEWPPPGVEAIAVRLVPAMEKALKSAPTRSVSVPLGAQQLTAWRVPLATGVLTVGFVAEAALRPEVRPTIDAELKRGDGA